MAAAYSTLPGDQEGGAGAELRASSRNSVHSDASAASATSSTPARALPLGRAISGTIGAIADPSVGSAPGLNPAAAVLQRRRSSSTPLVQLDPEERLQELVDSGQSRRDALRQVTRENMNAEVQLGVAESIEAGNLPLAWSCGVCCGAVCVFLVAFLIMACVVVAICTVILNLCGFILTIYFWLVDCHDQMALRHWLWVIQGVCLAEGCFGGLFKNCLNNMRGHFPNLSGTCAVVWTALAAAFRAWWCWNAQALVAAAPVQAHSCASWLPRFMGAFAYVLLLQTLIVVPVMSLGFQFVQWAAAHGHLTTNRRAKPGTLEAMKPFPYAPEAFADPDDANDTRPQRECPICLEEYSGEEVIIQTPCSHLMHSECLGKWLLTSHFCPICRADVEEPPEDNAAQVSSDAEP